MFLKDRFTFFELNFVRDFPNPLSFVNNTVITVAITASSTVPPDTTVLANVMSPDIIFCVILAAELALNAPLAAPKTADTRTLLHLIFLG